MPSKILALVLSFWCSMNPCFGQQDIMLLKTQPSTIIQDVVEAYMNELSFEGCLVKPCSLFMFVSSAGRDSFFVSIQQMNYFFTMDNNPSQFTFSHSNCQILVELNCPSQCDLFKHTKGIYESFRFPKKGEDVIEMESEATLCDFLVHDGKFVTINKVGCK